jgi:hypothetical protein
MYQFLFLGVFGCLRAQFQGLGFVFTIGYTSTHIYTCTDFDGTIMTILGQLYNINISYKTIPDGIAITLSLPETIDLCSTNKVCRGHQTDMLLLLYFHTRLAYVAIDI